MIMITIENDKIKTTTNNNYLKTHFLFIYKKIFFNVIDNDFCYNRKR